MEIEINEQFERALEILDKGNQSLLVVGKAGTGKSTLLKYFRERSHKKMAVLAPTGVAAINVEGETIHSFFNFQADILASEAKKLGGLIKGVRKKMINRLEFLVIDEISMVRADLLDCVDGYLRAARENSQAFGGVQMLFIGDLYQLPPVAKSSDNKALRKIYKSNYFYEAKVMEVFDLEMVELYKVYRQKDEGFVKLLNAIRNRSFNNRHLNKLNKQVNDGLIDEEFIYLTARNDRADEINRANMEKLAGRTREYKAEVKGEIEKSSFPVEEEIELKKGARVMLVNNDKKDRWVNGSLGKVIWMDDKAIRVKLDSNKVVKVEPNLWQIFKTVYDTEKGDLDKVVLGSYRQLPVKLAWAITIHKSQGKTFDKVMIDLGGGAFAQGQTYVALSRCRSLEGIRLAKPVRKEDVRINYGVIKFLTQFQYKKAAANYEIQNIDPEEIIKETIKNQGRVKITYLKAKDERSERVIEPRKMGLMKYQGAEFLGVEAFCHKAGQMRVFNVKRILEIGRAE